MQVSQLLKLGRGAVVELDRKLGEAIDIYVNNRLVARGEVVMVDDSRLGVTMTEIVKADARRDALKPSCPRRAGEVTPVIAKPSTRCIGVAADAAFPPRSGRTPHPRCLPHRRPLPRRRARSRQRHARPDHRLAGRRARPGRAHRDRPRREARPGGRRRHRAGPPARRRARSTSCCATSRTTSAPSCARWPPSAWRCRSSPAAPATIAEAAARAIRAGAREFLPLPPDPDLIAAILEAASGESHALIVRDPAMLAARAPRRAGGARRKPRC